MGKIDGLDGYVKELLDAKGYLHLFRDVAHRVGGVLAVNYATYSHNGAQNSILVPVMRAGVAFEKSFLKRIFPVPRLYYIATRRDPITLKPEVLYKTFGLDEKETDVVIILEPMLATGGTMLAVIDEINMSFSPKKIFVISAFVSKKAEKLLLHCHCGVEILALSKGHNLNEKGYLLIPDPYNQKEVATLDFGDEYCGTYH